MLALLLRESPEPASVDAPRRAVVLRRRASKGAAWRWGVALGSALVSVAASAQISGSVSLVSNYRFRGVSLSENKPAAQLGVAYDDALGWYAGAFGSTVELAAPAGRGVQVVPFAGYVWRTRAGTSWEIGADYSAFSGFARNYDYPEVYGGVAAGNLSARLYYSNRYFGHDSAAVYAEVNAAEPLLDRVRLLAHVGVIRISNAATYYAQSERVFDARVGIAVDFDPFSVQLSWAGISSASAGYGVTQARSRNGPLLTLQYPF